MDRVSLDRRRLRRYRRRMGQRGHRGAAQHRERGRRRLDAENAWRALGEYTGKASMVFRLPGIYGPGRSTIDDMQRRHARGALSSRARSSIAFTSKTSRQRSSAAIANPHRGPRLQRHRRRAGPAARCRGVWRRIARHARCRQASTLPSTSLSPMARSFYSESKRVSNARMKDRTRRPTCLPDVPRRSAGHCAQQPLTLFTGPSRVVRLSARMRGQRAISPSASGAGVHPYFGAKRAACCEALFPFWRSPWRRPRVPPSKPIRPTRLPKSSRHQLRPQHLRKALQRRPCPQRVTRQSPQTTTGEASKADRAKTDAASTERPPLDYEMEMLRRARAEQTAITPAKDAATPVTAAAPQPAVPPPAATPSPAAAPFAARACRCGSSSDNSCRSRAR